MPKRKPPSQREERRLDDTARAIAQGRETKKPDEPLRHEATNATFMSRLAKSISPRKEPGPAPSPSTKRPKKV